MNQEIPDIQAGFRKGRGTRGQIANIRWNSRKAYTSVSLTVLKPLTVWIITNCGQRWEYQTILPVSWETCMHVKKQQLEPYMEKLTGSGLREEYDKAASVTVFI